MKTILLMTISADGYIARSNSEAPWSSEEFARCNEFTAKVGNIIVGRKTYEIMRSAGDFNENIETVVLSKDPGTDIDKVHFVSSPKEAVHYLASKNFEIAVVGGGTNTNTAFLNERLLDEIILDVEPIILGEGLPLFSQDKRNIKLELLEFEKFDDHSFRVHYHVIEY